MGQYCFARCCLSSVVVCNAAGGRAGRPPDAWAVRRPRLHGGPVRLRPVMATPCFTAKWFFIRSSLCFRHFFLSQHCAAAAQCWLRKNDKNIAKTSSVFVLSLVIVIIFQKNNFIVRYIRLSISLSSDSIVVRRAPV